MRRETGKGKAGEKKKIIHIFLYHCKVVTSDAVEKWKKNPRK